MQYMTTSDASTRMHRCQNVVTACTVLPNLRGASCSKECVFLCAYRHWLLLHSILGVAETSKNLCGEGLNLSMMRHELECTYVNQ